MFAYIVFGLNLVWTRKLPRQKISTKVPQMFLFFAYFFLVQYNKFVCNIYKFNKKYTVLIIFFNVNVLSVLEKIPVDNMRFFHHLIVFCENKTLLV